MILRTAQLTASRYEWAHHRKMANDAGVADEKVVALERWRDSELFDDTERVALAAVEGIHDVALGDEDFTALERALGAEATIELVLLASFYECVARMIQALGLEVESEYEAWLGMPETGA
jgi:alkylhydroperoxidase family enzyme